jgi:hypothetical protein
MIIFFSFVSGCAQTSTGYYYNKIDKDGNLYGKRLTSNNYKGKEKLITQEELKNKNIHKFARDGKEYCVYTLATIIPLNFWNITNSYSKDIQRGIKELNAEGKDGNAMKDVILWDTEGTVLLLFGWYCNSFTGTLITEE